MDRNITAKVAGLLSLLAAIGIGVPGSAAAQAPKKRDLSFQGAEIEGERERPKDLYILPWQGSKPLSSGDWEIEFLGSADQTKDRDQLKQEAIYFEKTGAASP